MFIKSKVSTKKKLKKKTINAIDLLARRTPASFTWQMSHRHFIRDDSGGKIVDDNSRKMQVYLTCPKQNSLVRVAMVVVISKTN